MKSTKIKIAYDSVLPDTDARDRVRAKLNSRRSTKRTLPPIVVWPAATAALVCLAVLGYVFITPAQQHNEVISAPPAVSPSDTVKHTPPELPGTQAPFEMPGTQAQSVNSLTFVAFLANQPDVGWVGVNEFEFYLADLSPMFSALFCAERGLYIAPISFTIEGENITSFELSADTGSFAKLKRTVVDGFAPGTMRDFSELLMDPDSYEIVGSEVTLDGSYTGYSVMMYWIMDNVALDNMPREVDFRVTASFSDNSTTDMLVTVRLPDDQSASEWLFEPSFIDQRNESLPPEAFDGSMLQEEALKGLIDALGNLKQQFENRGQRAEGLLSIPLEDCELIPESFKVFTDVYRFDLGEHTFEWELIRGFQIEEGQAVRVAIKGDLEHETGYITVVMRGSDNSLAGMVYRAPQRMLP